MKRILTFFVAGAAIAALSACDDSGIQTQSQESTEKQEQPDEQRAIGEAPVEVDNKVAEFFRENVRQIALSVFNNNDNSAIVHRGVLINSSEELPEVMGNDGLPLKYPEIDFGSSTLVIGWWENRGGYYLVSQSIVTIQGEETINLIAGKTEGFYVTDARPVPFWGLYPKLTKRSTITVVCTYK